MSTAITQLAELGDPNSNGGDAASSTNNICGGCRDGRWLPPDGFPCHWPAPGPVVTLSTMTRGTPVSDPRRGGTRSVAKRAGRDRVEIFNLEPTYSFPRPEFVLSNGAVDPIVGASVRALCSATNNSTWI
jgi:hypothetical protein